MVARPINCSSWSEQLQSFEQTTAHVLSNIGSSCMEQLQLLVRKTPVGSSKKSTKTCRWCIEQLQLCGRASAIVWAKYCNWVGINCSCLGHQLQELIYRTSAEVAPNNCSSCTEQLQLLHRTTTIVSSNNCSSLGEELQLFRQKNCSCSTDHL